jgi:hypothetical protein
MVCGGLPGGSWESACLAWNPGDLPGAGTGDPQETPQDIPGRPPGDPPVRCNRLWSGGRSSLSACLEAVRTPPRAEGNTREHSREHNMRSPPQGPLDLRIRPRGFPAMLDPIPASKVISDTKSCQFLMILVWPGNHIFHHFCAPGGVEVFGRPHTGLPDPWSGSPGCLLGVSWDWGRVGGFQRCRTRFRLQKSVLIITMVSF